MVIRILEFVTSLCCFCRSLQYSILLSATTKFYLSITWPIQSDLNTHYNFVVHNDTLLFNFIPYGKGSTTISFKLNLYKFTQTTRCLSYLTSYVCLFDSLQTHFILTHFSKGSSHSVDGYGRIACI